MIITALVLLWRRDPKIALATAGFGVLFPALVYYYFFRVFQFFIRWEQIQTGFTPVPFPASWVFELGLFILAFLMVLQGAAKTQRNISPNPFPLFALMVGTLVFSCSWIFSEFAGPLEILVHVELLNMSASAFSAILAVTVFIIIPVIYASLRLTQPSTTTIEEPQIEMIEDSELELG